MSLVHENNSWFFFCQRFFSFSLESIANLNKHRSKKRKQKCGKYFFETAAQKLMINDQAKIKIIIVEKQLKIRKNSNYNMK